MLSAAGGGGGGIHVSQTKARVDAHDSVRLVDISKYYSTGRKCKIQHEILVFV